MKPFHFAVTGMDPAPYGGDHEEKWRRMIYDRAIQETKNIKNESLTVQTRFVIELRFTLSAVRYMDTDLDNLAIPVLNTIFNVGEGRMKRGALFQFPDVGVVKLTLTKELQTGAEIGVFVIIDWEA